MSTNEDAGQHFILPVTSTLSLVYAFSFLIAVLMTVASVAGLRYYTLIYPADELAQSFVPNDVVNLLIGLPMLLGSMWRAWRSELIGLLCWPGALFFVFYNYTAYVYAMPLNWAFPFHLALMILSLYTLIGLVTSIDGKPVKQRLHGIVPERFAGAVLAGLGVLFFLRVIGVLVNALSSGILVPDAELAVNVADFLTTPAWILGGILLWQRKEFGYVAGPGLLFQGSALFVALIVFLLLRSLLTSTPVAVADVVVIFVMGLICFIPFALFVRGVVTERKIVSG